MATPTATRPDRVTGLPPGVFVGSLGRRLVAHLVDVAVPAALLVLANALRDGGTAPRALALAAVVVSIGWGLLVWWMFATRAAGPGMRLMKLQLVGFTNGRPVGWVRFLVRAFVLALIIASVLGLLVMLVYLLRHPRYQGWHDLVVDSVVIRQRALAPRLSSSARAAAKPGGTTRPEAAGLPAPPPPGATDEERPEPVMATGTAGVSSPPTSAPAAATPAPERWPGSGVARPTTGAEPPAATAGPSWLAVLDDGQEVPVEGLVLLGRNPQPRPGDEAAELIMIVDESRTLSKLHLAIDLDEDGVFVVDRGSTNGSVVTSADGVRTRCAAGEAVRVGDGSVVTMGDRRFTLRRV